MVQAFEAPLEGSSVVAVLTLAQVDRTVEQLAHGFRRVEVVVVAADIAERIVGSLALRVQGPMMAASMAAERS